MFISFSKTLAKFGNMRVGLGFRLTKKNFVWAIFIWFFICIFQLMYYSLIFALWLMYAFAYAMYWLIKKIIITIKQYRINKMVADKK